MNRIDFSQTGGFPMDTDVLGFMQSSYELLGSLARLVGNNMILQGCRDLGTTVTDGVVVIGGELLPFRGGTKSARVVVKEEKGALLFEDGAMRQVEVVRYACFGMAVQNYPWSDFKRIANIRQLMGMIDNFTVSWENIQNKPLQFPPSPHGHAWGEITGKPTAYNPSEHTHDVSEIVGIGAGKVMTAGRVNGFTREVMETYVGSFTVTLVPGWQTAAVHCITHNLGRSKYVVTGQCINSDNPLVKFNCYYQDNNVCYITTSDDASLNPSHFNFMITVFD